MEENKHSCTEVLGVEVENKFIRRFLRSLAALAIVFVLGLSGHSRVVNGDWNFTNNDAIVIWEVIDKTDNMLSMRVWVEPNKGLILHDHDVVEIITVEKGVLNMNGLHYVEGDKVRIKKGDIHDPKNYQMQELILFVEFIKE